MKPRCRPCKRKQFLLLKTVSSRTVHQLVICGVTDKASDDTAAALQLILGRLVNLQARLDRQQSSHQEWTAAYVVIVVVAKVTSSHHALTTLVRFQNFLPDPVTIQSPPFAPSNFSGVPQARTHCACGASCVTTSRGCAIAGYNKNRIL